MKILQLVSCRGWSSDAYWAARGLNTVGGQEDLPLLSLQKARNLEPAFSLPSMILGGSPGAHRICRAVWSTGGL